MQMKHLNQKFLKMMIFSVLGLGVSVLADISPNEVATHNDNKLRFLGWGGAEDTHRWSMGKNSTIFFKLKEDKKQLTGQIVMGCGSLGKQRIIAKLNGTKIYEGTMEPSSNHLTMKFKPKLIKWGEENKLELDLPDAHMPTNGDVRVLAISMNSFVVK